MRDKLTSIIHYHLSGNLAKLGWNITPQFEHHKKWVNIRIRKKKGLFIHSRPNIMALFGYEWRHIMALFDHEWLNITILFGHAIMSDHTWPNKTLLFSLVWLNWTWKKKASKQKIRTMEWFSYSSSTLWWSIDWLLCFKTTMSVKKRRVWS